MFNKAVAFAESERKELVKNLRLEALAKVKRLEQIAEDLVRAVSQLNLARLGEDKVLAKKWAGAMDVVSLKLQKEFPTIDKMPSGEERKVMIGRTLDLVEDQFALSIGPYLNKEDKESRKMFEKIRAMLEMLLNLIRMCFILLFVGYFWPK